MGMKRFLLSAVFALLAMCTGNTGMAGDPTMQEILDGYYEAVGGKAAWKEISAVRQSGMLAAGTNRLPVVMLLKRPGKIRLEFEVGGQKGVQAWDGTSAWMFMPHVGQTAPQELPAEQRGGLERQADLDGPLLGTAPDRLQLIGGDTVAGTAVWAIEVGGEDGGEDGGKETVYVDQGSFLPMRVSSTVQMFAREMQVNNDYSDYREVDGVVIAHRIVTSMKGTEGEQALTIESVEINPDAPDSLFQKPVD